MRESSLLLEEGRDLASGCPCAHGAVGWHPVTASPHPGYTVESWRWGSRTRPGTVGQHVVGWDEPGLDVGPALEQNPTKN